MCCALVCVACVQILMSASSAFERYFRSGTGRPFPEMTHDTQLCSLRNIQIRQNIGVVVVKIWTTVGRLIL